MHNTTPGRSIIYLSPRKEKKTTTFLHAAIQPLLFLLRACSSRAEASDVPPKPSSGPWCSEGKALFSYFYPKSCLLLVGLGRACF